ncbi:hypothetical protein MMC29_005806 [Sticta canariensis]|nr:hypothetical protein [Sticta canariensis]
MSPLLPLTQHILNLLTSPSKISSPLDSTINDFAPLQPHLQTLLPDRPEAVLALAREKLHTWPYAEVPDYWRRAFVDASLVLAIKKIRAALSVRGGEHVEVGEEGEDEWEEVRDTKSLVGIERKFGQQSAKDVEQVKRGSNGKRRRDEEDWNGDLNGDGEAKDEDWIEEVVRTLDMAVIMAGGIGRESLIEALLTALQTHIDPHPSALVPSRKRLKIGPSSIDHNDVDEFPTSSPPGIFVPKITFPVPTRASPPSMMAFESHMREDGGRGDGPLVIKGALEHWPAMTERPWRSRGYLMRRTLGGRRLVPVEVGRSYTDEGWGQRILTFGAFLDEYLMRKGHGDGEEEDEETRGAKIGYLAQHDLFAQIPSLRNDICVPDYCYTAPPPLSHLQKRQTPQLSEPLLNAWLGPAGTVSSLHTDPYHNILCQVVGRKYVRLYRPDQTEKLYPRGMEQGGVVDMSNTSQVDKVEVEEFTKMNADVGLVEAGEKTGQGRGEEEDKFPLFRTASYQETILNEGECLYIPAGWWHYVRSLTVSFSVSFWWN